MPDVITCDFETAYSRDYSLSKITTEAYIRSSLFEVIGVAIKVNNGEAKWHPKPQVEAALRAVNWEDAIVVCQNTAFDGAILSWNYGVKPLVWADTLGMSRALFPHEKSHSLAAQAERAGIGAKGTEVISAMGKWYKDFTPEELHKYGLYCINDVELTYELFRRYMAMGFPKKELKLNDLTIRMFTEPHLTLDAGLLEDHLLDVRAKKHALIAAIAGEGSDEEVKAVLMSNEKFAAALQELGVDPPKKISLTTGKEAWAFAKTDDEFQALQEHEDERVQALVAARLGTKTTIEETRTETLIDYAKRGSFPVALRYYGSLTGRWSAESSAKVNCMTPGHELLTPTGWVDIAEWDGRAPVMQWWPDGSMSWETNPTKVAVQYEGDLIQINAPFVRAVFTPEHRMPSFYNGKVRVRTAGWVAEHSGLDGIPFGGKYGGGSGGLTPAQVAFLVAVAADGSIRPPNGLSFGFVKERKILRIRQLAAAAEVTLREFVSNGVTHFRCAASNLPAWVVKGYGPWVLDLSAECLDTLLDELVHWDGFVNSRNGAPTFCTCVEEQAQWVATVAALRGWRPSLYKYSRAATTRGYVCHVYFGTSPYTSVDTKRHVGKIPYKGTVYCPSVASSFVLVRYNNAIHVTGNCQNIPRDSRIKQAITAPEGMMLCGADLSNIELRLGLWLAGQDDKLQLLSSGLDLYKDFAATAFGVPYEEITKPQRQVGKTASLSLIYGTGAKKLQDALRIMGKIRLPEEEAKRIVDVYRSSYQAIVNAWKQGETALEMINSDQSMSLFREGICTVEGKKGIRLPSGLYLQFPGLRRTQDEKTGKVGWVFDSKYGPERIYGAKIFQQCDQSIARCVMAEGVLRIQKWASVKLMVHDSAYWLAREDEAEASLQRGIDCLTAPISYCPGLPLAAEGAYGKTLKDC